MMTKGTQTADLLPPPKRSAKNWRKAFLSVGEADAFATNHAARQKEAFDRYLGRAVNWIDISQKAIDRSIAAFVGDVLDAELSKGPDHDWL